MEEEEEAGRGSRQGRSERGGGGTRTLPTIPAQEKPLYLPLTPLFWTGLMMAPEGEAEPPPPARQMEDQCPPHRQYWPSYEQWRGSLPPYPHLELGGKEEEERKLEWWGKTHPAPPNAHANVCLPHPMPDDPNSPHLPTCHVFGNMPNSDPSPPHLPQFVVTEGEGGGGG